jgi:hypothetical protein
LPITNLRFEVSLQSVGSLRDEVNAESAGWMEMRTVTGPSSAVQWVLRGGPYSVSSHVWQVQVVCPPTIT